MNQFKRESRYLVFKRSDVSNFLTAYEQAELAELHDTIAKRRAMAGRPHLEAVVVEHDWPEYEPTWKAIEARVLGSSLE